MEGKTNFLGKPVVIALVQHPCFCVNAIHPCVCLPGGFPFLLFCSRSFSFCHRTCSHLGGKEIFVGAQRQRIKNQTSWPESCWDFTFGLPSATSLQGGWGSEGVPVAPSQTDAPVQSLTAPASQLSPGPSAEWEMTSHATSLLMHPCPGPFRETSSWERQFIQYLLLSFYFLRVKTGFCVS